MFFLVSSSLFVELFILLTLVCVCVCVYHLPGCELADVCECARTCSCTARPDSLPPWFLRFSFRLLTTSSLSLCFDVSLCGFCRVCVLAGRWLGPDALELVTDPDRGRGGGIMDGGTWLPLRSRYMPRWHHTGSYQLHPGEEALRQPDVLLFGKIKLL